MVLQVVSHSKSVTSSCQMVDTDAWVLGEVAALIFKTVFSFKSEGPYTPQSLFHQQRKMSAWY